MIGLAAGGIGIAEALHANNDGSKLRAQLSSLRERTSHDEARIGQVAQQMTKIPGKATMATAQANIAAAQTQMTGLSRAVHGIQGQDARYTNCIPELQTELNGLHHQLDNPRAQRQPKLFLHQQLKPGLPRLQQGARTGRDRWPRHGPSKDIPAGLIQCA